jgi:hypothetical protein
MLTEVSYVGLDYVEFRNLSLLPGFHEAILNNAVQSHNKGIIEDWIEFFRKDWTTAIYLHSFPKLISSLRASLASDKGMMLLMNRIFEKADMTADDTDVSEFRKTIIGSFGELIPELTKKLIYTETYEFIKENREFLPKFYIHNSTSK